MPKVNVKMLSKAALLVVVEAAVKEKLFPEHALVQLYRVDLHNQLVAISKRMAVLEEKAKASRLSGKQKSAIYKQMNELAALGRKKLTVFKGLPAEAEANHAD